MARLPYVEADDLSDSVRKAIGQLPPLNLFRMLGHADTTFSHYVRFAASILTDLELDPKLRELAILQVARQTGAHYEWVQHVAIGRHVGLSDEQVAAVSSGEIETAPALSAIERAVLDFAAETVSTPRVSDATFAAVREQLSPREIVELLLTIGNYLMLARLMTTLEIEIDPPASAQGLQRGG
jgi:4-carboxymuconolactone decarboxylase